MAPRANWKGYLKLGLLSCPVALYTAASAAERVHFHTLNRATGHRVRREFVDAETEEPVDREDQVKGYEVGDEDFVVLEQDEIDAAVPESTKTLEIEAFIACPDVDLKYVDKPYYLAPSGKAGEEAFAVIRAAMEAQDVAGVARTVLFRRERALLLRVREGGIVASTLHYDHELRDEAEVLDEIPKLKLSAEMIDLAKHIIKTKRGRFDPAAFDDRYEAALVAMIRAKQAGRPLPKPARPKEGKVVDLLEALRRSAGQKGGNGTKAAASKKKAPAAKKPATKKPAAKKPAAKTGARRRSKTAAPTRKAS